MPEIHQTNAQADEFTKTNKNSLKASIALYKTLPIGFQRVIVAASIGFLVIVSIAIFHPSLHERWKFGTDMTLNLLVLLVVAVQTYIYLGQWQAMQTSIESAERHTIYAERAYLTAKLEGNRGSGFLFQLRIRNSGNTPANNVVVSYAFSFSADPPDGLDADFPNHAPLGVIVGKDDQVIDVPFTEDISRHIYQLEFVTREIGFYVWGVIRYQTIFQEKGGRRSWFCFHQEWEFGEGAPCESGNEVD